MKSAVVLLLGLMFAVGCGGDTAGVAVGDVALAEVIVDVVAADERAEVVPSDVPVMPDTAPVDTTDAAAPADAVNADTPCLPSCGGKDCGDDGCGGSCGGCDDGNPCTDDECVGGECKHGLKDLDELDVEDCLCAEDEDCEPLEDGDLCNGSLVCDLDAEPSTCTLDEATIVLCALPAGFSPDCNLPVCISETGGCAVTTVNEVGACDDGDPCTTDDACSEGSCVGGPAPSCDDEDLCTVDSCEPEEGGCVHACAAANPGDACCEEDSCEGASACIGDPVIDLIDPTGQDLGEVIVITGSGFGDEQGEGYVRLCGLKVTEVLSWSDGAIALVLPPGSHSGPVTVVDPWGYVSAPHHYTVNYNKHNEDPFRVWEPTVFTVKDVGYYTVGVRIEMEPGWVYLYTPTMLTTWSVTDIPTPVSAVALPSQATELELVGPHLFVTGSFGLEIYHTTDLQVGGFPSTNPPVRAAYAGVLTSSTAHAVVDGEVSAKGNPLHGTLVAMFEWTMPEAQADSNRVLFFLWDPQTETLEWLGTFEDTDNLTGRILYDGVLWLHPDVPKLILGECTVITGGTCTLREYGISNLDALFEDPAAACLSGIATLPSVFEVPRDMKPYGDRIWVGAYGSTLNPTSYAAFHVFDLSPEGPPVHTTSIDACSALLTGGSTPDEMQPCLDDDDCPEGAGTCTNGWCVDRWTCAADEDCPLNQGQDPPWEQVCLGGWCQALCVDDADCTKANTSSDCNDFFPNAPDPCVCIEGTCRYCRTDHMGALDVIPEAGLVVGMAGMSTDQPEKHNVFLFSADAGPGEHIPLSSAETANFGMDVAAVPGRISVADEWTAAQLFSYETMPAIGITGFAEPAWTDPMNRIFSPGWAMHVRQHPTLHDGRVYWGQGGIVGASVDDLADTSKWVSMNQQNALPYTRTTGDGRGDAVLFKGFIENFVTGTKPSHYQLYRVDPASGSLTLLNDPLTESCPGMGEVLWWDDHVALSAEFGSGLAALYVNPDVTDGTACEGDEDCDAIGDQCESSACIDGTCRCAVVERRSLVAPLESVAKPFLFWIKTYAAWIDLERVDGDTVAAGQGWAYDPIGKGTSPPVPPDWGGLFFFDVTYPDGAPPSPDSPDLEISLVPSDPPALNCTRGLRIWTIDALEIEGKTWLLSTLDNDVLDPEPHVFSIFLVKVEDIPTLNLQCLPIESDDYNAQACQDQLAERSIIHPTTGQFSPSFTNLGMDTHLAAEFWVHEGVPHVVVANRLGSGLPNAQQHVGVWVFKVDDPDIAGFDLGRIHQPNVYFQPLAFSSSMIAPGHFTGHPDMNTHLIPEAADLQRLDDGDILVFGTGCTIARMGTP